MKFGLIACLWVATLLSASVYAQGQGSQRPSPVYTSLSQLNPTESDATIEPQLKADIEHMIEITHLKERIIEVSRLRFAKLRPKLTASLPPTLNRDKILIEYAEKYTSLFESNNYMGEVARIYAEYFSDDDIKGMIQFYQTPVGQHYIAKIAEVTADMAQLADTAQVEGTPHIWEELCREYPEIQGKTKNCIKPDAEKKSLLTKPAFEQQVGQFSPMLR